MRSPPVKLNLTHQQLIEKYGSIDVPLKIELLDESDYQLTVGGVSRIMLQFINYFKLKPIWIALGPAYPYRAFKNISMKFVDLYLEN